MEPATIIARADSVRGEVILRRRVEAAAVTDELIVNGAFAMDSIETGSEQELGRLAAGSNRVLLGGLGLGYTAAAALSNPIGRLDIVEVEGCLVEWAKSGRTQMLQWVAAHPRVRLYVGDIAEVVLRPSTPSGLDVPRGPWDAILLDVDNGPDFPIHSHNALLYSAPALSAASEQLTPGGLLAIWCQGKTPSLEATLRQLGPAVQALPIESQRGERRLHHVIYTLRRAVEPVRSR